MNRVIDGKLEGTDIYVGSEEWYFWLEYCAEPFWYLWKEHNIYCVKQNGNYWIAKDHKHKNATSVGITNKVSIEKLNIACIKISEKLTTPNNEKNKVTYS